MTRLIIFSRNASNKLVGNYAVKIVPQFSRDLFQLFIQTKK